jgi:hypothetical protein
MPWRQEPTYHTVHWPEYFRILLRREDFCPLE